ncbi:MAG: leukotoxin LktA family filamentous adhesin [Endomicrobia bacterium]|nr:leukotoxin LktA family filamentous adhesin [Endomicrobiia bacterium]
MKKKIIAWVVAAAFLCSQTGFAQMIVTDGKTDTSVNVNGNTTDIHTNTVSGKTGFNSFKEFNVWKDKTVNLHLKENMNNLVNLVHDQATEINGVLNAFKNGKIGGNVFFLNPHGIMIGQSGIVNVGALTLATPTKEFMDSVISSDKSVSSLITKAILAGDMPINPSGTISVKGKINAYDGVGIDGGNVEIAKTGEIKTLKASDIVNLETVKDTEVVIKDGKILIKSQNDAVISGKIIADGHDSVNGADISITAKNDIELLDGAHISSSGSGLNSSGGEIFIFADNDATFNKGALIEAKGGLTGNGGFIELSGKRTVNLNGGIFDAYAKYGLMGNVYIDPIIINVTGDYATYLSGANYLLEAADSINIKSGANLFTAKPGEDSGSVTMKAMNITIGDSVTIDASTSEAGKNWGDITLEASAKGAGTLSATAESSIDIGNNVVLKGKNVNITAESENTYDDSSTNDSNMNFDLSTDGILNTVGGLLTQISDATEGSLNAAFAKSDVKARISIGDNTKITAQEELNIKTSADSKITVKTEADSLALAAGVNLVNSNIEIKKAELSAKDITIEAKSKITSEVEAKSTSDDLNAAVAVSVAISNTSVDLNNGTKITADNNAAISAVNEEDIKTKGDAKKSEGDNKISVGLAINYNDIKKDVRIKDADITAKKNIEIAGKNIKIEDSKIKSVDTTEKGDVKITAEDKGAELISTRKATIDISGSEIDGKDVTIEATAENKYTYDDVTSIINVNDLTDGILGTVNEVLDLVDKISENAVSGKIAKSDVTANINISDTVINADNNISIKTFADSQATAKAEAKNLALAAGVNLVESKINLSKTELNAEKDVTVEAKSKITSEVEAKSESDEKYKGAVALSVSIADTAVEFDADSKIDAKENATISVISEKDIKTKATAPKKKAEGGDGDGGGDGKAKLAIGVPVNYTDLVNNADINGSIKSGKDIKIASEGDNRRSTAADPDVKINTKNIEAVKDINISGRGIEIKDSIIKSVGDGTTKGDVTVKASDKGAELISTRKAFIDISDTEIEGKDITIEASAENKYDYKELEDTIEIRDLTDTALAVTNKVLDLIGDLTEDAIKGKVAKSDVSANINISGDTKINADNDINIKTSVESQTTVKTDAKGLAASVAVNLSESAIDIGKATLKADKDINIEATNKITSEVEAKSTSHAFGDTVELGGAVGVSYIEGTTSINISKDADLEAKENISINANTEKDTSLTVETKAGKKANLGLTVGVNLAEVENTASVKGKVKAGKDVNIDSKIDSKNTKQNISASTGNEKSEEDKKKDEDKEEGQNSKSKDTKDSNLQKKTNDKSEDANDNSGVKKEKGSSDDGNTITLAGAVLYADVKNTAAAEISGSDAEVEALNDINMKAEVINANIKQFVDAQVEGSQDSTVKGTGAVVIGTYEDKVTAVVQDGASIDAGKKINISSNHEMPFKSEWFDVFEKFIDNPGLDTGKEIFEKISSTTKEGEGTTEEKIVTSLKDDLVNTWVRSSAPEGESKDNSENNNGSSDKKQGGSDFSVTASGAVNITNYDFTSEAYIKDAKVNQKDNAFDGSSLRTDEQSVNVEAKSKTTSVTVGGIFGDSYKSPLGQGGSDVGVGGTYNQVWYKTKTNAYIEGTELYANDLNVKADYDHLDVTIGIAGGSSKTFGLQGVFNWLKVDSDVNAFIESSDIKIETGNLTDGKLNIEAKYTPLLVNIAGSLSMSETAAVGASVTVNDITKNTNAKIIDSIINNSQNAKLYALSDGLIHSYAIAAAYAGKDSSKSGQQADNPDKNNMADSSSGTSGGSGDSGSFGIAISGSAGVSNITGETNASIEGGSDYTGTQNLEIIAKEDSDIVNATGGVSLTSPDADTGVAVAGAGSISWIKNNAKAYIEDSTVDNEGDITLDAKSEAGIVSVAVGLAGSFSSDGVAVAGSGSINLTDNETQGYIKNSKITSKGNLKINSYDDSNIFAIAGAAGIALGAAGIGAAIGVNILNNNTSSYIEDSDISLTDDVTKNNISLDAVNSSDIRSIAGSVGVGLGQVGAAVTVNVNVIGNETQSYIKGKGLEAIKAQDISLSAKDDSYIFAIAGAAGIGNNVGIGIGVGFNSLSNSAEAFIENAEIENEGNIEVKALSESEIQLIIAALGGAGTVGVAGAAGIGLVHNKANAYIKNSSIISEGSIGLLADSRNDINLYSGAAAIGGTVGVGGNVGLHFVGSRSYASVTNSDITAKGKGNALSSSSFGGLRGLAVKSNILDDIFVFNAAIAGSGTVAVAGGITGSVIDGISIAKIENSDINKDYDASTAADYNNDSGISVIAENETNATTIAGAVSVSGTAAIGVAADFETMNNEVKAYIDNSGASTKMINAKGDVEVKTKNTEKYAAAVVSGAFSGGASVAGNVVVGVNQSENTAYIKNSNVTARDVSVEAKDTVIIGEADPVKGKIGIAMGTAAVGFYAGVSGTVFASIISNSTIAEIVNSNITASGNIRLDAEGYQKTFANLASFGAGIAGVAITAGVSVNNTDTFARIISTDGKTYTLNAEEDITVNAKNTLEVDKIYISAAGGIAGVAAGVSVGVYNNNVTAGIGSGINIEKSNNVSVDAQNDKKIKDIVVSGAGGLVGVTATVDVIVVGGNVDTDNRAKEDAEEDPNTGTYLKDTDKGISDSMKMSNMLGKSDIGGGGLIDANNIDGFDSDYMEIYNAPPRKNGTFAYIDGDVKASGDVNVSAGDKTVIDSTIGSGSVGAVAVNAAVAVQSLKTRTEASISGKISANDINITANSDTANDTDIYMGAIGAFAGINAGVAVINSNNITNAYIDAGSIINKARDINVLAKSNSYINSNFINIAAGYVAAGAVVGVVNKDGGTNALIGSNVIIGDQSAVNPTVNSLTVKAQTDNDVEVNMVSAAGGAGAAAANIFVVDVTDNLNAYTSAGSKLNLYNLNVLTNGNTAVNANFAGVAVGALAIAASVAVSRINLSNNAYIGSNNTVKAKNVTVKAYHNASSDAKAIGGSGGLIGLNGIWIDNSVSGNVVSSLKDNSVFQVSDKLSVLSDSYVSQKAEAVTLTAGFVAIGGVVLKNKSAVNTKAQLGGGLSIFADSDVNNNKTGTGEIEVNSGAVTNLFSKSQSGNVGGLSVSGVVSTTDNNSLNEVIIGGTNASNIYAQNLSVNAKSVSNQNSFADSASLGLLTVGVIELYNKSDSDTNVDITGKTNITANNIAIKSSNIFNKSGSGANIDAISAAVASGFFAKSITDIYNDARVNFGKDTNITTKKDADKNSAFVIDLYNNSTGVDLTKLKTVAGASVSAVESSVTNNSNTEAAFAGKIYAGKDFTINSKSDQNLDTQTYIDAVAFISGVQGNSNSIANIKNNITFLTGADIYAAGDINLNLSKSQTPGIGVAEIEGWAFYKSKSITEIYNMAVIPIDARSKANSIINVDDKVNVNSGAELKSSKNVNIGSTEGRSEERGFLNIYTPLGEVATKESDRKIERNVNSLLTVDGKVIAGANNDIRITINQGPDADADGVGDFVYVVFGNEETTVEYETGIMNLVNNIIKQKEALIKLRGEYGASDEIVGAINMEIARLDAQLVSLGFRETVNGKEVDIYEGAYVPYIELADMAAGRGDIQIEMNSLAGSGLLKANAQATVEIVNNSDHFLRINDILISDDANGDIFVNHILQTGSKYGNLNLSSNKSDGSQTVISIINEGYPSAKMTPNLELLGDILNPAGSVYITSQGSIESKGSILAREIHITAAKDFVQSSLKNDYIFHVGGDPRNVWNSVANTNENAKTDTSSSTKQDESSFGRSSIIANNVYISGTYLDINGLIQAGVKDWTLTVGGSIRLNFGDGTIAAAVSDYLSKNSSTASPLYKLHSSHGNLAAYYNVLTGDIEVSSVNIEGGKLYLYGSIMNTSAQGYGKLVALDGYARVTINNTSSSDIILNNINTDKKIEGEIKITDLAKPKVYNNEGKLVALETTYTFDGTNIKMVTNERGKSAVYGANNGTFTYNPRSDIRYTWTTGSQDVVRREYYYENNSFWGIDWLVPDVSRMDKTGEWKVVDPLAKGEYITYGGGSLYTYDYQYKGDTGEIVTNDVDGSYSSGWWIFSVKTYWRRVTTQQGYNNYNVHSIQAGNPISISFDGYRTAQDININSASNVGLRGSINAGNSANVNITSTGGAIEGISGGAVIAGKDITLKAVNGIGNYNPITVSLKGGIFNAINSGSGNINLIAKTNDSKFGVFKIGSVTTEDGDLKLISDEEIAANSASSKIKGVNTEIESKRGSITGYNGADLEIEADTLKAAASGDIKLIKRAAGDLGISAVYAYGGDVRLTVENGSVHDINTNAYIDERKKSELLALWENQLGLFDENHTWTRDQLLYAMNGAKAGGGLGAFDVYTKEDNIRGVNVFINAGGSVGLNEKSFYIGMNGFSFAQLDENQKLLLASADYHNTTWHYDDAGDPSKLTGITIANQKDVNINASGKLNIDAKGYVYIASQRDINIDQIKSGGNIMVRSSENIYNASLSNNANIIGKDVFLGSSNGNIGSSDNKIKLDMTGILSASAANADKSIYISSDNNLSLYSLYASNEIVIDSKGNIYGAGYDSSDYENINARVINITAENVGTVERGLSVALNPGDGAILNVSANGNIYVNNVGSRDLYYGNLTAGEYISVMSKNGAIYGFDENSRITAKNLILKALNNKIGAADNKIKADVKEVISAFAKSDIYIEAQGKGNFEEIESSEGLVDLSSTGNLYADKILAAEDINIVSAGSIETGTQYITSKNGGINITGKKEVEVNAAVSAKGDIEMKSEESDLKITGSVISSEGKAALSSEGKTEITGNITADKDITADSKKELIVKGDLNANGGVDLKSGEKTDIEGSITAGEDIISLVENGNLNIKGAIRSFEGNINFNILNGALIIGNKAVSERGNVFAEAYGDIIMDGAGVAGSGIYADKITLISQNGDIGKPNRRLYLDSENPVSVLANLEALNGGIYVEGFTNGLTIDYFDAGKDLVVIANGDITAVYLGDTAPNVTAANITLHSLTGSIGKENSRIIAAPIEEKGRVNLSAVTGIYLDQYVHTTFYSDYVRNSGGGTVSLLVPDNNAFIVDLSISKNTDLNVNFTDNKYVKNIRVGYMDIKKLMVHPAAVWSPVFMTASEDRYRILTGVNIMDGIEKMQNETLIISSNLLQTEE